MNLRLIRDERHRNTMTLAELTSRMASWINGAYEAVLFEEAGAAVGYALYLREADYIYLRHFFVEREQRRRGIGRAAIGWLWEHEWNKGRVRLDVLVHNTVGIAFWRSVGFADYCVTMELEPKP